jgi:predicted nuclease of restriction endonuclease-like (RecB) superfamily
MDGSRDFKTKSLVQSVATSRLGETSVNTSFYLRGISHVQNKMAEEKLDPSTTTTQEEQIKDLFVHASPTERSRKGKFNS